MWRRNPSTLLVGMLIGTATVKTIWSFLKELKIEFSCDSAVPLLSYINEKDKNTVSKRYTHPSVHSSVIYNYQDVKQPKCTSVDKCIKNMWYRCTLEYSSAIKKNEILPFRATWMGLEDVTLNDISWRKIL